VISSAAVPGRTVVFYVSGHGFGHASRVIEVINATLARLPGTTIEIRTRAPRWLFDLTVAGPFGFTAADTDVGVVQVDALTPDIDATMRRAAAFYERADAVVEREAAALQATHAAAVVADVPPLAFEAARRAAVPSVALSNFTWDWIYEDYARALDLESSLADRIRRMHGLAREAWRLPLHGGFAGFHRVRELPFVARRARRDRGDTRARLGWTGERPVVLASFGGVGLPSLPLERAAAPRSFLIVSTGDPQASRRADGPLQRSPCDGLVIVDERALYREGLRYEDLVAAADVVLTKPGYGIIAECVANRTALLYTSRGRFAEYDVLVAGMPRWLRCRHVERRDLLAGHWRRHIEALLSQPAPAEIPDVGGADVAAGWIEDLLKETAPA
jgi:L-arabinokinase